jgi:hypothetical protein
MYAQQQKLHAPFHMHQQPPPPPLPPSQPHAYGTPQKPNQYDSFYSGNGTASAPTSLHDQRKASTIQTQNRNSALKMVDISGRKN